MAVERLRDSSLRTKPIVVCSRHSPRSLVFSTSPEARKEGIWEGLPLTKALRRCRRLVVLPPDEVLYRRAAEEIARVLGLSLARVKWLLRKGKEGLRAHLSKRLGAGPRTVRR